MEACARGGEVFYVSTVGEAISRKAAVVRDDAVEMRGRCPEASPQNTGGDYRKDQATPL